MAGSSRLARHPSNHIEEGEDRGEPGPSRFPPTAEQPEAWKNDKSFVLQLGCLNKFGLRAPCDRMVTISFPLSEEYCITGYQESDDVAVPTFVEINFVIFVVLEAKALGEVLGMESEGLPVLTRITEEQRVELMRHATKKPKSGRMLLASLEPRELRDYVIQRKEQLRIQPYDKTAVPESHAYFLKEEFFHRGRYNWAAHKVEHLKFSLRTANFSRPVKSMMVEYIAAVAPSVYQLYEGLGQPPKPHMPRQTQTQAARGTSSKKGKGEQEVLRRSPRGITSPFREAPHPSSECAPLVACRVDATKLPGSEKRCRRNSKVVEDDIEMDTADLKKARTETKNSAVRVLKLLAIFKYERNRTKLDRGREKLKQDKKELAKDRENLRLEKLAWRAQVCGTQTTLEVPVQ